MKKLLTALVVILPLAASAQYEPAPAPGYAPAPSYGPGGALGRRGPWYIGFGFGAGGGNVSGQGTTLSLDEINESMWYGSVSPTDVSFNFKLGVTMSPNVLLGFDATGVLSMVSESSSSTSAGIQNYDAVVTWFPQGEGLFVRGGAGLSKLTFKFDDPYAGSGSDSWTGFNALAGVGYAFWLGQSFNLTLNLDYSIQSYGSSSSDPESSNFFAAWVGFDWY